MDEARHKENFKPINHKALFMDKNKGVGRWIPPFVFSALSRMLKIDFFNDPILYNHGHKKDVEFAQASKEAFNVTVDVVELSKVYPHIKLLVNDLLTKVDNMDGTFIPVNQHFVITFGNAIPFETFDKRHTAMEWAQLVKEHVYIIAEDPEREFSYINN